MFLERKFVVLGIVFLASLALARDNKIVEQVNAYIKPYVESNNFSGAVLVRKDGQVIFRRAFGFADREHQTRNESETRFHIASISMQFTAIAVLRLVDAGLLSLDTTVGDYFPGTAGAQKIRIRDLLTQRSGLTDINDLPEYADILQRHQTPTDLVARIKGRPILFEPGSKFLHEEHSAYNLLALIVEKKTGLPFASAVRHLILVPTGLDSSGIDDDSVHNASRIAIGYEPDGVSGLKPALRIHWSAKTGNGSAYATVADEAKLVERLFERHLLKTPSLSAILDTSQRVGYGWFRGTNQRFGETAYYMNGRAPGFASFVLYLPRERLTVVVFSNIYSSATTTIGNDIAAISLGRSYTPFRVANSVPEDKYLQGYAGTFQFGADFYQPNARITLSATGTELQLKWPSGDSSPLIPLDQDRFMDRAYWQEIKIERNTAGQPVAIEYDRFHGNAVGP